MYWTRAVSIEETEASFVGVGCSQLTVSIPCPVTRNASLQAGQSLSGIFVQGISGITTDRVREDVQYWMRSGL